MKKTHAVAVALLLGLAAVFGVLAAGRTAGLGAAAHTQTPSASISGRAQQLDRVALQLQRALRNRPPALPPLPAASQSVSVAAPRVVYRRPAPIVVVKHRSHHDDSGEYEAQSGGGGND